MEPKKHRRRSLLHRGSKRGGQGGSTKGRGHRPPPKERKRGDQEVIVHLDGGRNWPVKMHRGEEGGYSICIRKH